MSNIDIIFYNLSNIKLKSTKCDKFKEPKNIKPGVEVVLNVKVKLELALYEKEL